MNGYLKKPGLITCLFAAVLLSALLGCSPNPVDVAGQYIDVKMYDKAESILRGELNSNPDNEAAHMMLGRCLLEAGDEDGAARELDAAVVINDKLAGVATGIYLDAAKLILATGGDVSQAVRHLMRVVAMSEQSSGDIAELCRKEAAKRVTLPGGGDDTLLLFDTALRLDPGLGNKVAELCIEGAKTLVVDDLDAAELYAEYAMDLNPVHADDVADLYRRMALAKYDVGDTGPARDYADRAVKLNAELADDTRIRKVLISEDLSRNEGRVVTMLERLAAAEMAFAEAHDGRYAAADELGASEAGARLTEFLASMESDGYTFAIIVSPIGANFYVMAAPTKYEGSGIKSYFVDSTGVVRSGDLDGKMPSARPGDELFGGRLPEADN